MPMFGRIGKSRFSALFFAKFFNSGGLISILRYFWRELNGFGPLDEF